MTPDILLGLFDFTPVCLIVMIAGTLLSLSSTFDCWLLTGV